MTDQKILDDLAAAEKDIRRIESLLNSIYYHSQLSTFSTRPMIGVMVSGCRFVADNLVVLAEKIKGA